MPKDPSTALAQFVDKRRRQWAAHFKKHIHPTWEKNLNAVKKIDSDSKSWKKNEGEDWRSNTFIGVVRTKIWTLYAILIDVGLQGGMLPFALGASPYDLERMGEQELADLEQKIDRMTDKIREQLRDRHTDREHMKMFLSYGYYGVAWSKYNVKESTNREFEPTLMLDNPELAQYLDPEQLEQFIAFEPVEDQKTIPGHEYRSVWNMLWDVEEEDIQQGEGIIENMMCSAYQLRQNKGEPGFIDEKIEEVIAEHDNRKTLEAKETESLPPGLREIENRTKTIHRYEHWGRAPLALVERFEKEELKGRRYTGADVEEDEEFSGKDIEIMCQVANGEIVRFFRNNDGKRPYHKSVWETDLDETTGRGVADNLDHIQYLFNGLVRAFEDNKKLSANVIVALKRRYFSDPSQLDIIKPGMQLDLSDECDDARKAIMPVIIPDVGETLLSALSLADKWKDEESLIPTILQGFTQTKQKADTATEMMMLSENAGKYIGMGIRSHDEGQVEPQITDIYEYNMLDPECDPKAKGNFKVHATGFTSFQNKAVRGERIKLLLAMMVEMQLTGEIKIPPHLREVYKSLDLDPDEFMKTEEEKQQEQEAQQAALLEQMKLEAALKAGVPPEQEAQIAAQGREHEAGLDMMEREHQATLKRDENEGKFEKDVLIEAMRLAGKEQQSVYS